MSGDGKDMDGILREIRTLRSGEAPPKREAAETPKVGLFRGFLLTVPAVAAAVVLYGEMRIRLDLPVNDFETVLPWLPVLIASLGLDEARPSCRRHWAILALTSVMGGVASAFAAIGMAWFLVHLVPDYADGVVAGVSGLLLCAAAVLLVHWIADRLTRADDLIFPRDAEENERVAG